MYLVNEIDFVSNNFAAEVFPLNNGMIAIFDSEADYALKLAEYFNLKSGLNYSVSVFTDYESLEDYLSKNSIDILLISENYSSYIEKLHKVSNIFILTEGNIQALAKERPSLYKYQSTEHILREVMSCYASSTSGTSGSITTSSPARVIGVYSPVKRCGKTCFSLAYGCIRSLSENCLYINLEEYPGFTYFTADDSVGDFSDLLYFYRQNPSNIDKKLISLCRNYHNLSYIPPMQFSYDIKNMEESDFTGLIKSIRVVNDFQTILLDISDSVKNVPSLLNLCDIIYMPTTQDIQSQYKIDDFFQSIQAVSTENIRDKTTILRLPHPPEDLFFTGNGSVPTSDFIEKLLYSEFGTYIRERIQND